MLRAVFVAVTFFALAFPAQAQHDPFLNDEGLRRAFIGKTHVGFYRRFIERYGHIVFEERYDPDGTMTYRGEDGVEARGRWRIAENRICFVYDQADFLPGCFAVTFAEGCFYSFETDDEGRVLGLADDRWWIRSYLKGTEPDCAAEDLVS